MLETNTRPQHPHRECFPHTVNTVHLFLSECTPTVLCNINCQYYYYVSEVDHTYLVIHTVYTLYVHVRTYVYIYVCMCVCVMVRGRKLGGSKSTAGLHSRCSPATLM